MEKFNLICEDRTAVVDGDPRVLNKDVEMPEGVGSIHWYGKRGELVFKMDDYGKQPSNEEFFSDEAAKYQWVIDAHAKAKQRDEDKRKAAIAARKAAEDAEKEAMRAQHEGD